MGEESSTANAPSLLLLRRRFSAAFFKNLTPLFVSAQRRTAASERFGIRLPPQRFRRSWRRSVASLFPFLHLDFVSLLNVIFFKSLSLHTMVRIVIELEVVEYDVCNVLSFA
ncbi:unnamed protein product [Cochlearia groenlandica]